MEPDEKSKQDNDTMNKVPIIDNIDWTDNGKISFSFQYLPPISTYSIIRYELYYCYINGNDDYWLQYAKNNWRTITISCSNNFNKNMELRIATNKDIYDNEKNKDIQLLLKLRCELKGKKWQIHTFYTEFSKIYFARSISIPFIINKQTPISQILNSIFKLQDDDVNDTEIINKSRKELSSLYDKYSNDIGMINVFTKLLKQQIETFYLSKFSKLLSSSNNSLPKYLFEIEKGINYETEHLFPFIETFITEQDKQRVISIIVNTAFDFDGAKDNEIKQLLRDKNNGLNDLLVASIVETTSNNTQGSDQFLLCFKHLDEIKKCTLNGFIIDSIIDIFTKNNHIIADLSIITIYNATKKFVTSKLNDSSIYHKAIENGMKSYHESDKSKQEFYSIIDNFISLQSIQDDDIKQDKCSDLMEFEEIFSKIGSGSCQQQISDRFESYIKELSLKCIDKHKPADRPKSHQLTLDLLTLHRNMLMIVRTQFSDKQLYHTALKQGFEECMNYEAIQECKYKDKCYVQASLARYTRDLLKKGNKLSEANDLENTMDHIVMLYGYIRDKDIFERKYQKFLAERLLLQLSVSKQAERLMIDKLKNEAGYHWTSKLEDMCRDVERSKELMIDFHKRYPIETQDIELNVTVCTTGAWDKHTTQPVKYPTDVSICMEKFKIYYLSRFSGRQLRVQSCRGQANVCVQFNAKCKKILVVSTYQMLVLLLFNNKKTMTFKEMLDLTGIPREGLKWAVLSMAHPKIKVMRKAPNTKEIADNHKFQINPKYTHPRAKIPVPTLEDKNAETEEDKRRMEAVYRLRRHQMDAAIVRIMKARRTLKHADLVTEVVKQLRHNFKPRSADIKKRISNLIELEYLRRDENEHQLYHYKI